MTVPGIFLQILRAMQILWPSGVTHGESDYYKAAVYHHQRLGNIGSDSPRDIIQLNMDVFRTQAEIASRKGADIIVFPENGLYPSLPSREEVRPFLENVPDPRQTSWNPCSNPDPQKPILTNLSCIAQRNNLVIVANMGDIQPCSVNKDPHCPLDGVYQYNTNVAFGRKGELLAKYHKMHLFFETAFDTPQKKEYGIFETDFGTFGTMICFDIIFGEATRMVQETGIRNIAFPTWWFDQHPMLSAIQYHQAWAFTNGVNLLSANVYNPETGSLGSAVFSGFEGILNATYTPQLIIARVPKKPTGPVKTPDESISVFRTVPYTPSGLYPPKIPANYGYQHDDFENCTLVRLTSASGDVTACNHGLCCSLKYNAPSMKEQYFLVAFNGTRNILNTYFLAEEYCILARCEDKDGKACSIFPLRAQTNFAYVFLQGNFTTSYVYPSFQVNDMDLHVPHRWNYTLHESIAHIKAYPSLPLLSVNLYGRCYDRDP